jgi:phytoene dehydrogenase-like protein
VRPADWFGLEPRAYAARKAGLEAHLLGLVEDALPGFRDGIVSLESGSPRTFQAFTLHSLGRVGGVPQTPRSANFHAQHHSSGVRGLLMAGETVFPGQGTLGVTVSGYNAARTASRLLGRAHRPLPRPAEGRTIRKEAV